MKATVTIDDELLYRAKKFSGISGNPQLVERALEYIIAYKQAVARAEETGNPNDLRLTILQLYRNVEPE